jgi:hypothetical protein
MRGAIPPPQYVFISWFLVKHRDTFTFKVPFSNNISHSKGDFYGNREITCFKEKINVNFTKQGSILSEVPLKISIPFDAT